MKITSFDSQMSDIYEVATSDFKHPLLTLAKFVFADDKPNGNNQGIEYEDFEDIKKSAIDMPIKMKFLGEAGAGGHPGSVTIGHIRSMDEMTLEDGTHQLIAEGVLYAGEYPNEVKYLKEAYAEGKAPGASWEISYNDEKKDGPISWLKGVITRAATFVRNPAYGKRTQLLALASSELTDAELDARILEIASDIKPKNPLEGGSNKMEEELKKAKEDLEKALADLEALRTEKTTLETANAELTTKVTSQEEVISEFKRKELITDRSAKITEAGLKVDSDPEKVEKAFWLSLSEDAFAEYLETLKSIKPTEPKKVGLASLRVELPRPTDGGAGEGKKLSIDELKVNFRERNRNSVQSE